MDPIPSITKLSDEWKLVRDDNTQVSYHEHLTMEKAESDHREYKLVRLNNDLQALLVHDPTTEQSAAAMNVGVGYFSDPDDMPGLAHLCEHLLFTGSRRFPSRDGFLKYIRGHCGTSNAYTVASNACYFFSINSDYSAIIPLIPTGFHSEGLPPPQRKLSPFEGALQRFAAFFTSPLLRKDRITNEVKVVESEYNSNREADSHRLFQLFKEQAKNHHPWAKFGIGNSKTLTRDGGQHEYILQWWQRHYSASVMRLVIMGRESLDDLTRLAVNNFSGIPDNNESSQLGSTESPWGDDQKGYITYANSINDTFTMEISFCLESKDEPYKSKPTTYASRLIMRQGPGSLHAHLKERHWINQLSSSLQQPARGFFFLIIKAKLTERGFDQYGLVLETIYAYLYALAKTWTFPSWKRHYEEFQSIQNDKFNFSEKPNARCLVNHLSEVMVIHESVPKSELLRAPTGVWKLDEHAVKKVLQECLTPKSACVMLSSKSLHPDSNPLDLQSEPWYGTLYKRKKLDETLFTNAKRSKTFRHLVPPERNRFIPEGSLSKPHLVPRQAGMSTVWFIPSTLPKGYIGVYIRSPFARMSPTDPDSAKNHVMSKLVAAILGDVLRTEFYDALTAGIRFSVIYDDEGNLILQISGYTEKMLDLLGHLLGRMKSCAIEERLLSDYKEMFRQTFYNEQRANPAMISRQLLDCALRNIGWTPEEMESVLIDSNEITLKDVEEHRRLLLTFARTTVLVTGSFNRKDARDAQHIVDHTIPSSRDSDAGNSTNRVDPGRDWVYFYDLPNAAETNNAVEYYLQIDDPSQQPTLLLFASIFKDPFVNTLRNRENLGYNISSHALVRGPALGIVFRVMSRYSTVLIEARINQFLENCRGSIERMTDEDFEAFRDALRKNLLQKPENQEQKAGRLASSILSETPFDLRKRNAHAIRKLRKDDISRFYTKYIAPYPHMITGFKDRDTFNSLVALRSTSRAKFSIHALSSHARVDSTSVTYDRVYDLKQFSKSADTQNS